MNYELLVSIAIEVVGFAVMFGVMKQKIDNTIKDLEELKKDYKQDLTALQVRQNKTDDTLQSIKDSLAGLNSKMDLILDGKIKITN